VLRRITALVVLCAMLLSATLLLISCRPQDPDWLGESPASRASIDAAQKLGDAVVSYFGGNIDLAAVEEFVAQSAQEDLAQMLSLLNRPTSCTVNEVVGGESSSTRKVVLRFVEAESEQPIKFTLSIDVQSDRTTIDAVNPGSIADSIGPPWTPVGIFVAVVVLVVSVYLVVRLRKHHGASDG
jgi:hypothetical protein